MMSVLLLAVAVGCDEEQPEASEPQEAVDEAKVEELDDPPETADETAESEPEEAVAEDDEAADNDGSFDYPDFELDELDDDARVQLADLATSELCPCPDSVVSLHECMQQEERCEEADELATSLKGAVAEGADSDEAFDQVARERADTADTHEFSVDDAPLKGSADADVIIVEFADFQCPHCRTAAQAMDEVAERFGDEVGIYFKHFPLGNPTSDQASQAAMAAQEQGRFWPMHQLLFENQRQIDRAMIEQFARQLGLNFDRFRSDMEDEALQARIARDRHEGLEAGVQGTPAIFINGERYTGAISGAAIIANVSSQLDES